MRLRNVHKVGLQLTLYIGFIMKKFINRPDNVVEKCCKGLSCFTQARPTCRDTKSWSA